MTILEGSLGRIRSNIKTSEPRSFFCSVAQDALWGYAPWGIPRSLTYSLTHLAPQFLYFDIYALAAPQILSQYYGEVRGI